jgi:hypothetical protein
MGHEPARDAPKLVMDDWDEPAERSLVASVPRE